MPRVVNPFLPIQARLISFLSSLPRALPPPPWVRTPSTGSASAAVPPAEIEEQLAGVPVYALANAAQEGEGEGLDSSLLWTSHPLQNPNTAVRIGDTQVSSLEGITKL